MTTRVTDAPSAQQLPEPKKATRMTDAPTAQRRTQGQLTMFTHGCMAGLAQGKLLMY